jgi:hypothetical protein
MDYNSIDTAELATMLESLRSIVKKIANAGLNSMKGCFNQTASTASTRLSINLLFSMQ